ncbi:hypothetical protein GGF32_008829 [Allomyces javanicus]|nr:hypothetical protein GGF32_008829 [Allomyces javanicus]
MSSTITFVANSTAPTTAASVTNLTTVQYGLLLPFSIVGAWWRSEFLFAADAVLYGIAHAQAAGFLAGANVTLALSDEYSATDSSLRRTVFGVLDLLQQNVSALIGSGFSDASKASAAITSVVHVPQCSFSSSTADLSFKGQFPLFFRTADTSQMLGRSMTRVLLYYKWQRVAVLTDSSSGTSFVQSAALELTTSASRANVAITMQLDFADESMFATILAMLTETQSRIVALFNVSPVAANLLQFLYGAGWLSPDKVMLMGNDFREDLCAITATASRCQAIMAASTYLFVASGPTGSDQILATYLTEHPDRVPLPQYANPQMLGGFYRAFGCGYAMTAGLHRLVTGNNSTLSALAARDATLYSAMKLRYFNVTTSPFPEYDFRIDANGDLSSPNMTLQSLVRNATSRAYEFVDNVVLGPDGCALKLINPVVFPGGHVPQDAPTPVLLNPTIHSAGGVIVAVLTGLTLLFTLVTVVVFTLRRRDPAVRATSRLSTYLLHLAVLCGVACVCLYYGVPRAAWQCAARRWLLRLSSGLVFAATLPKAFRVYRLLHSPVGGQPGEWTMVKATAMILAVELAAFGVDSSSPVLPEFVQLDLTTAHVGCYASDQWAAFKVGIVIAVNIGLIVAGLYLTYHTRAIASRYNDSKRLAVVIYNTAFTTAVVMIIFFSPTLTARSTTIVMLLIWYMVTFAALFLHVPVLLGLFRGHPAESQTRDFFSRISLAPSTAAPAASNDEKRPGGGGGGGGGGSKRSGAKRSVSIPVTNVAAPSRAQETTTCWRWTVQVKKDVPWWRHVWRVVRGKWGVEWQPMHLWILVASHDAVLCVSEADVEDPDKPRPTYSGSIQSFELFLPDTDADTYDYLASLIVTERDRDDDDAASIASSIPDALASAAMLRGVHLFRTLVVRFATPHDRAMWVAVMQAPHRPVVSGAQTDAV